MTLLTIITNVCDELGLPRPSTVVGNADQTARTLLSHANKVGEDVMKAHDWTSLTRTHTFTVASGTGEYALPTDYDRLKFNTEWDRTNKRPLIGPLDGVDWQILKSSALGATGIGYRFRIFRSASGTTRKIYLDPVPTNSADSIAFEYISNGWCYKASDSSLQSAWALDSDVPILDPTLLELGIQLRYRRGRGLAFASEADEYTMWLTSLKSQDRPARILSLSPSGGRRLLDWRNVPETGIG